MYATENQKGAHFSKCFITTKQNLKEHNNITVIHSVYFEQKDNTN